MAKNVKGAKLIFGDIIVFLLVLAALFCVATPHFKRIEERGRVQNAKAKLKTIYNAEARYYGLNSRYTESLNELAVIDPKVNQGLNDTAKGRKTDCDWDYYIIVANDSDFKVFAKRIKGKGFAGKLNIDSSGVYGGSHLLLNW